MKTIRKIMIGDEEVILDSSLLEFNEASLAEFQGKLALYYDYFGAKLADAEYLLQRYEALADNIYTDKFHHFREIEGKSEKTSETLAKNDAEYIKAKEDVAQKKRDVKHLQLHLKAWDKAHENATSRGHTLRREMDKLSFGNIGVRSSTDINDIIQ